MACSYRYISRWSVKPLEHPACGCRVIECFEDAKTAAVAERIVTDRYPQYAGLSFQIECLIPAKFQQKA
jgi:hypothetical protein